MKQSIKGRSPLFSWLIVLIAIVSAGIFIFASHRPAPEPNQNQLPVFKVTSAAPVSNQSLMVPQTNAMKVSGTIAKVLPNYSNFLMRPFPVAYDSPHFQWTMADGKDTNVIRQLAHNHLEYQRMVDENPRIFQRRLVYLKETPAEVFESAKLTGQPVQQLTLPGIDQELSFQIVGKESSGSSRQGMFSGHLAGNTDSMVTMAFQDGREAFTVIDPKDNIYVVGEPREDGQVIVKAIDPATYGVGPEENGDDSIKTQPAKK